MENKSENEYNNDVIKVLDMFKGKNYTHTLEVLERCIKVLGLRSTVD